MKTINRLIATLIPGTLALGAYAQPTDSAMTNSTSDAQIALPIYRAQEITVDAFGTASLNQHTIDHLSASRIDHHVRLGAGAGINYFFCRYIGVGAEAYSQGTDNQFIYAASGNVILRLPIYNTGLAPYIFGGGGYQFDDYREGFGQAGAGLEFRFTPNIGIFVDARAVIPAETGNYGLGRAGVSFSF